MNEFAKGGHRSTQMAADYGFFCGKCRAVSDRSCSWLCLISDPPADAMQQRETTNLERLVTRCCANRPNGPHIKEGTTRSLFAIQIPCTLVKQKVIQGLGLGKVGDNVVGTILKRGLSGGEKRRTTVGQELVVKQALALLDEPTSGLDGTAAFDVIKV